MKYTFTYLLACGFILTACTDSGNDANVFETQVESIEKAEEVEQQILDAAERQRQQIEENIDP